jgi:cell wall assembly regulator SMI1
MDNSVHENTSYDSFWLRVESCFQRRAPELFAALNPPATEEQLRAIEAELGYRLHCEVRAAYLRHDGTVHREDGGYERGANFAILNAMAAWIPLRFAIADWRTLKEFNSRLKITNPEMFPPYDDHWENLSVRPVSWDEGHFPIGDEGTSFRVFVDMVPAGRGQAGQIFGDDGMAEAKIYAPSFNTLIGAIADHLESGTLQFNVSHGGLYDPRTGEQAVRFYPNLVS